MNGLILVDKPSGCTSHDVVNRLRKLVGTRRIGHLGTLDPMATGLLGLLIGAATRLAPFYGKEDKTYQAAIDFGFTSDTYDAQGEVTPTGAPPPRETDVRKALESFRGRFFQTPPPVSAKKIAGIPAYKYARKKVPVKLAPVEVEIKELSIQDINEARLEMEVTCSTGTYIRSLAHDLGQRLGCGAILGRLRRIRMGSFSIDHARTLEQISELAQAGKIAQSLLTSAELLTQFPAERVNPVVEAHIRQGRQFRTSPFVVPEGSPIVRVLSRSGELIAIGRMIIPNLYHPATVLQPDPAG
jgi:tRNA pseudouridine55 synthase